MLSVSMGSPEPRDSDGSSIASPFTISALKCICSTLIWTLNCRSPVESGSVSCALHQEARRAGSLRQGSRLQAVLSRHHVRATSVITLKATTQICVAYSAVAVL